MTQKKTNLFILGGMRSGTTSLFRYLEAYSEIYGLRIKESHYFTQPWLTSAYNTRKDC